MTKIKTLTILFVISALAGCGSLGPMQLMEGPLYTPAFDVLALDTVNDGAEKIKYKEFTSMYENGEYQGNGVFFITDNGAYLAEWDYIGYEYKLVYKVSRQEIVSVSDSRVNRDIGFDSDLLVIKDTQGYRVGFSLQGKNAARSILRNL
ncbi:hypothetical protein FCV43_18925 [Vibrio genomosp. F6]|uniref:hypothetical protein n=1 Tax=Vibrio genomosp. F6 TaxID=723172 RepID=UPI0010BD1C5E|nr:hypothetical protein [Vibrio genomosp. F6]TKF15326.1 hypothetical protein FCV43_18925 [Vibrio genomosp. F6]